MDGGKYYAIEPDGWDGRSALPVILTAHGYSGSAQSILSREHIGDAYSDAGVLWLVPEGENNSWATPNSPETRDTRHRDDVAFLGAVLDDAGERWPIDPRRVAASGFSQGASMASQLSCADPRRWPVTMPVSGTFWNDMPPMCEAAVAVRHTHGTDDSTWPLDGRPISTFHQGSVPESIAMWAANGGCSAEPRSETEAGRTCSVYADCAGGEVRVCFHDGAHVFPTDEAALQVEWLGLLGWW